MEKTLTEICEYLNNYFWRSKVNVKLNITGGTFSVDFLKEGQYFRILGSDFNDGVYKYPATGLVDENFEGSIWTMAVPPTVIAIASDIKKWQDKYEDVDSAAMSPFTSESYTVYSYSKGSGSSDDSSGGWQSVFGKKLAPYRRLRNI